LKRPRIVAGVPPRKALQKGEETISFNLLRFLCRKPVRVSARVID